jgi:hypothetical protein
MTKRANPKRDPLNLDGYLPNEGAAKTGLNKALLGRNLGRIKEFTKYKSRRAGLMFVEVEPAGPAPSAPPAIIRMRETGFHKRISVPCDVGTGNTRTDSAGSNVQARTEISPGTSLQNARRTKARKAQPTVFV